MRGKSTTGIIFLFIGLGLFLEALNLWDFENIIGVYWPLILIIIGAKKLIERSSSYINGIILIFLGVLIQLRNLDILYNASKFFWAGVFLLVGIYLLSCKEVFTLRHKDFFKSGNGEDTIKAGALFSSCKSRNYSKAFKGGSLTSLFGSVELDLLDADMSPAGAYIDAFVGFGGINIVVPEHWKVVITGMPIAGGFSNKTRNRDTNDGRPILKINCIAICGGMDIKNYFN
ncbi:DUF5668 domain-containing protein [Clostridium sp. Marseille-Q2269]|uniref:LiaF transmembrane domain-containing protein n=1 Tax=Clostridium sp. Marseille-Q2269 TaxID=2942205 RepID=UPI00207344D8|nr:DUF5668 domain-containing protein [Clostridium sp. Marseille-Q2269]